MQVPKVSEGRRWQLGLGVALLRRGLVIATAALGGTSSKSAGSRTEGEGRLRRGVQGEPPPSSRRRSSTPSSCRPRYGAQHRAGRLRPCDKKVNYNLALKCWKNDGCKTGTGGKLTVAYVEPFGENVYRQMSKMEFILQALTYQVDRQDHLPERPLRPEPGDLADFRAVIAQHVSAIVTYPDFGDAMLPVFKEATKAGHPGRDLRLGLRHRAGHELHDGRRREHLQARQGVRDDHEQAGQVRQHRLPRRLPGQPAVGGLAEVREAGAQPEHPRRGQGADELGSRRRSSRSSPASSRRTPTSRAGATSTALGMAQGAFAAYKAAGKPFNAVLTLGPTTSAMGCKAEQLNNPKLKVYYYTAGQLADPRRPDGR